MQWGQNGMCQATADFGQLSVPCLYKNGCTVSLGVRGLEIVFGTDVDCSPP